MIGDPDGTKDLAHLRGHHGDLPAAALLHDGAPPRLADVLRLGPQDVRESGRRAVMEEAGRKEIGMMVPVVFLILPVTVLFAIYPGVAFLRLAV